MPLLRCSLVGNVARREVSGPRLEGFQNGAKKHRWDGDGDAERSIATALPGVFWALLAGKCSSGVLLCMVPGQRSLRNSVC